MLYIVKCKQCNYVIVSENVLNIKSAMAMHLNKSHGSDIDFVADLRLDDFIDDFAITRIRDEETILYLKMAIKTETFWDFYRNGSRYAEGLPKSQVFSV